MNYTKRLNSPYSVNADFRAVSSISAQQNERNSVMATLINQGTLHFTPVGGTKTSIVSNTTNTAFNIIYGLQVYHGASPDTYVAGDTIHYTVILKNTGNGNLIYPTVTVDFGGGALDYVAGSAVAFLYNGTDVIGYPVTVSAEDSVFSFSKLIPAGGIVFLAYETVVNDTAGDTIVSTATGRASEGVATGPVISDSDTATISVRPVSIVKSAPASASVGETIQYRFTITNNTRTPVVLNQVTDQLPAQFSLTAVTFTANCTETPLTEGTDYTVSQEGLLTVNSPGDYILPACETVVFAVIGVVSA